MPPHVRRSRASLPLQNSVARVPTEPERETKIRELKAELAELSQSTSPESALRVAAIIRELVALESPESQNPPASSSS
jgi:hypothetical protein